ncbi:hypothetical protein B0H14DRAFT_2712593 [Mycena olivaceomarginata]|nr:hypothetical protein B0H14DRAFT_2712593 [Mycena olivaceomarginata]
MTVPVPFPPRPPHILLIMPILRVLLHLIALPYQRRLVLQMRIPMQRLSSHAPNVAEPTWKCHYTENLMKKCGMRRMQQS